MSYTFAPHMDRRTHLETETRDGADWERTVEIWTVPFDVAPVAVCTHPWTRRNTGGSTGERQPGSKTMTGASAGVAAVPMGGDA